MLLLLASCNSSEELTPKEKKELQAEFEKHVDSAFIFSEVEQKQIREKLKKHTHDLFKDIGEEVEK